MHRCQECGHESGKWHGRCPGCGQWGSVVEEPGSPPAGATGDGALGDAIDAEFAALVAQGGRDTPVPLAEVSSSDVAHRATGIGELDRVLGGGLAPGATILLGGEPGIGKSTLVLQALGAVARSGLPALLVTSEESKAQVRQRAERLDVLEGRCYVVDEESVAAITGHLDAVGPAVVAVDSIQTVRDPRVGSAAGSVAQVRECASVLSDAARRAGATLVLVGHVTKDGSLAGPRVLEHLVDVVCTFEGDRHHSLRVLRGVKNRFGPAGELGLFDMRERGLVEMDDAASVFLGGRRADTPGSAVVPAVEGRRPLLTEVQALVTRAAGGANGQAGPRRTVNGLDPNRVTVLCGVLDKLLGLPVSGCDVFVSAAGGVRLNDPAADLAVCVAVASSYSDRPVASDTAWIGEVGLAGEVRDVPHLDRRVREASRVGFARVVVPVGSVHTACQAAGVDTAVVAVADLAEALALLVERPGRKPTQGPMGGRSGRPPRDAGSDAAALESGSRSRQS